MCLGVILALTLLMGCSSVGTDGGPVDISEGMPAAQGEGLHRVWGSWQFVADPVEGRLDVHELRSADFHLNALPFLEPPPLLNLTLESLEFNGNLIDCQIGLRHPFLGLTEFTGFDVCGILITSGSVAGFTDPDLRIAGEGDMRLLNPDGWTRWWNPSEFPHNGTISSYVDGLLGPPDSYGHYTSTLNAYKYFSDELGPDDDISKLDPSGRGLFRAGQKNIRRYQIDLGTTGLVFNYAVDACWKFPDGPAPWIAPDDFAEDANRPEAYRISITESDKTLFYDPVAGKAEGEVSLLIGVYDWFNADKNDVSVECGGVFTPLATNAPIGGGAGYSTYRVDILDAQPTSNDPLNLFITIATDEVGYQGLLPGKKVSSYFFYSMEVPVGVIEPEFPCGDIVLEENFDSYSEGSKLPPPWGVYWSGNDAGCYVTGEQKYSAPYSWRSSDFPWWARHDVIPMTRKDHFCYEARIMLTSTDFPAHMGFTYKISGSESKAFAALVLVGPDYTPYQWYYIEAQVDCVQNYWEYWVDGESKGHYDWTDETGEYAFTHFFIGTTNHPVNGNAGVVYFDDIKLYADQ